MINSVLVEGLSRKELDNMISKTVKDAVTGVIAMQKPETRLLTREQTAHLLCIDLSTLHAWVKKGKLKSHAIGSRRYFKEQDILDALVELKPGRHD